MSTAKVRYCKDCKDWIVGSHDCPMRCRGCRRLLTELELAIIEIVRKRLGSTAPPLCRDCSKMIAAHA